MVDLIGIAEIAQMAGLTPQAISNKRTRDRAFPAPVAVLAQGPIFHRHEIKQYLEDRGHTPLSGISTAPTAGKVRILMQPFASERLGDVLRANLADQRWTHLRSAVAFAKVSGVRHIALPLADFAARAKVHLSVGVDHNGTSFEALESLLTAVRDHGILSVCHNEAASTFHPKVHVFHNRAEALALIGSGNLTEGGLYTNYEATTVVQLALDQEADYRFFEELIGAMDLWSSGVGTSIRLSPANLQSLAQQGYVLKEAAIAATKKSGPGKVTDASGGLFATVGVPRPPVAPAGPTSVASGVGGPSPRTGAPKSSVTSQSFVMKVQQTDAGFGQTSNGAGRRSPEIFIPLAARDAAPDFWGWDSLFNEDPTRPGKLDRKNVKIWLNGQFHEISMMTWPIKHDFRIRSESLRSSLAVGDIVKFEKADPGTLYDYAVEVIKPGRPEYARSERMCVNRVRNSAKTWGYY